MKTVHSNAGNRHPSKRVRTPGIQPGETVVTVQGHPTPKLPHEQDESASSQNEVPSQDVIKQAAKDVKAGIQDDDRGPPMDELYQREFRDQGDASGRPDEAHLPARGAQGAKGSGTRH